MKKNNLSMIFGIVFGIALLPLAYLNLGLGLALAFAENGWFGYTTYIYAALAVITIIGSAFARKQIIVTRIILLISTIIHIVVTVYLFISGLFVESLVLGVVYIAGVVIGLIATTFALLAKNRDDYQSPPPSFTPPSQGAQM